MEQQKQQLQRVRTWFQCTVCGRYFASESGFSNHRVGEVGTPSRRCLSDAELKRKGYSVKPVLLVKRREERPYDEPGQLWHQGGRGWK